MISLSETVDTLHVSWINSTQLWNHHCDIESMLHLDYQPETTCIATYPTLPQWYPKPRWDDVFDVVLLTKALWRALSNAKPTCWICMVRHALNYNLSVCCLSFIKDNSCPVAAGHDHYGSVIGHYSVCSRGGRKSFHRAMQIEWFQTFPQFKNWNESSARNPVLYRRSNSADPHGVGINSLVNVRDQLI